MTTTHSTTHTYKHTAACVRVYVCVCSRVFARRKTVPTNVKSRARDSSRPDPSTWPRRLTLQCAPGGHDAVANPAAGTGKTFRHCAAAALTCRCIRERRAYCRKMPPERSGVGQRGPFGGMGHAHTRVCSSTSPPPPPTKTVWDGERLLHVPVYLDIVCG